MTNALRFPAALMEIVPQLMSVIVMMGGSALFAIYVSYVHILRVMFKIYEPTLTPFY